MICSPLRLSIMRLIKSFTIEVITFSGLHEIYTPTPFSDRQHVAQLHPMLLSKSELSHLHSWNLTTPHNVSLHHRPKTWHLTWQSPNLSRHPSTEGRMSRDDELEISDIICAVPKYRGVATMHWLPVNKVARNDG